MSQFGSAVNTILVSSKSIEAECRELVNGLGLPIDAHELLRLPSSRDERMPFLESELEASKRRVIAIFLVILAGCNW